MTRLPRSFFARPTVIVARALLGCLLVHETPAGRVVGRLVEVEAYCGPRDPASHAYRRTPRSEVMWGLPGTAYVYLSHGIHACMNVVSEPLGRPGAVLLRALEPVDGVALMQRRRGIAALRDLARGARPPGAIVATPRIGISAAIVRRWRLVVGGSPFLSRPAR